MAQRVLTLRQGLCGGQSLRLQGHPKAGAGKSMPAEPGRGVQIAF